MSLYNLSASFFFLFIITFPVSITISQFFAITSIFFTILHLIQKKLIFKELYSKEFLVAFSIYLTILLSSQFDKKLFSTEVSLFWMSLAFWNSRILSRNDNHREKIKLALLISATVILITGIISLFTEMRLNLFIRSFFTKIETFRPQHFAGSYFGIPTYLPIGLMNTHLTFGGLLGIVFPGIVLYTIFSWKIISNLQRLSLVIMNLLFMIIIFFNQSRSIWIGLIFIFIVLSFKFRKEIPKLKKSSWIFLVLLIVFSSSVFFIYKGNFLIQRIFSESLKDTSTENQRYYIYKLSLPLVQENFPLGVGTGRFKIEHEKISSSLIQEKEHLWYELYITPRGHAHHDLLHFLVIGGILPSILFLYFWHLLINRFFRAKLNSISSLFIGFIVLLPAGFFQCYFQDSEVLLPFYTLAGIFFGITDEDLTEKKYNTQTSFFLVLIMALSIIQILYSTRKDIDEVFQRRIWTKNQETFLKDRKTISNTLKSLGNEIDVKNIQDGFKMEGCFTHEYGVPPKIRTKPFQIRLFTEKEKNYPKKLKLNLYRRDTFDQDQVYKVHETRLILEKEFTLQEEITKLEFKDFIELKDSKKFPENIYFIDFEFQYIPNDETQKTIILPKIDLGKNCSFD